jgi:hypothetical protein
MSEVNRETTESSHFRSGRLGGIGLEAVQLALPTGEPNNRGVLLKASPSNTTYLYVGNAGVSASNGYPLSPGESLSLPLMDTQSVWIIADDVGQAIHWMCV